MTKIPSFQSVSSMPESPLPPQSQVLTSSGGSHWASRWPTRLLISTPLVLSLLLTGCATSTSAKAPAKPAIEFSSDPAVLETQVRGALSARQFSTAFDAAQKLRELKPDSAVALDLLAHACMGMGLFDEAAATFFAASQQTVNEERVAWVGRLLTAKGQREKARGFLEEALGVLPKSWEITSVLVAAQETNEAKLRVLDAFLASNPGHPEAQRIARNFRDSQNVPYNRVTKGNGQAVRTRLTDTFTTTLRINGQDVRTAISSSDASVYSLYLTQATALKLGLTMPAGQEELQVQGFGGDRTARAWQLVIPRLELGDLVVENVPVLVTDSPNSTEIDASLNMHMLPGYAWMLDRKHEILELYPPGVARPVQTTRSKALPYYQFPGQMLVDAGFLNLDTKQSIRGKISWSTGQSVSVFHRPYLVEYGVGHIDTTRTVTLVGAAGYDKAVEVSRMSLLLAGDQFLGGAFSGITSGIASGMGQKQDTFLAADLLGTGPYTAFGLVGHDILGRYRMLIDPAGNQLTLETYQP